MSLKKLFSWAKNKTIATQVYVEGDVNGGTVAGGDIHIINHGIPLEQLIALSKKLGVTENERDAWMQKYQELENFVANRGDEIAKQAKAFLDQGDLTRAEQLFQQALAKDVKNAAEHAFSLAQIKDLQYNSTEAIRYYRQSLQFNPDNAEAWNNLGHLLRRVGELDEAIAAYHKVLALGESHQHQQTIAAAYGNLGNIYRIRGDLDKAIEFYEKGLTIQIALGDKQGMAAKYGNLGNIYYIRGDLDKAIEFYQKSLTIKEVLGMKEGMANTYGNLGNVYQARGDLDKAIEFQQKALRIDESMGNKQGMAEDYANLGSVYKLKGNRAEAKRYYQQSIELFKYIGSPNAKKAQALLDALQ